MARCVGRGRGAETDRQTVHSEYIRDYTEPSDRHDEYADKRRLPRVRVCNRQTKDNTEWRTDHLHLIMHVMRERNGEYLTNVFF